MANNFFNTMMEIKNDPMVFLQVKEAIEKEKSMGKYLDNKNVDNTCLAYYLKADFNKEQIFELALGVLHNVDISLYGHKFYTARQMREIRTGLQQGVNILTVVDARFDDRQMQEIRFWMINEMDVSIIANRRISWLQMKRIGDLVVKGEIDKAKEMAKECADENLAHENWAMDANSVKSFISPRKRK